jgi:hypothetical protein
MPRPFSDRTDPIFGRAPDLDYLLERSTRPGVTALVSRAQMGKTTLLLELARQLSQPAPATLLGRQPTLVGYTRTDQVPDPLLYALQDLYARWLANSTYAQQASNLYRQRKVR